MAKPVVQLKSEASIATLTIDDPLQRVNTLNEAFLTSFAAAIDAVEAQRGEIAGVVLTSAKRTFFAGDDLHDLYGATPERAGELTAFVRAVKLQMRRLERLGMPVVAAINGAALGGGLELALACHRRVAIDRADVRIGLPEVTLGLLPGGGGVVRSVRLLGLNTALDAVLLSGTRYSPTGAAELGLVDEVCASPEALLEAAIAWIHANPAPAQPWDRSAAIPCGNAYDPAIEASLPALAARLQAKHRGAPMSAQVNILAAAVESTQVDFDTALEIETRYFVELATGQHSKNIVKGTFFDLQTVRSGASRPDEPASEPAQTVAVLGAGLMGAGIALAAASCGLAVRLKDIDLARAEAGKATVERALARQAKRGALAPDAADDVLGRIVPVADVADLADADIVVEAVFEDLGLKASVLDEVLGAIGPDVLVASNTSTLPIGSLAGALSRPVDLVGLHFFSPVERMDLVEIVVPDGAPPTVVARAFDFVRQLRKTPIVVGDRRGFFTSRVILQRLLEAAAMVGEGVAPASIEQASLQAGYPLGTLALVDETAASLSHKIYSLFRDEALANGRPWVEHPGAAVLSYFVEEAQRPSRAAGAGFYDYPDGARAGLWSGLAERYPVTSTDHDLAELRDRLLFTEALETQRCFEAGVLHSEADANVGSLLGIAYPTWTGGTAQFVAGFPGGVAAFRARAEELRQRYGARFAVPDRVGAASTSAS